MGKLERRMSYESNILGYRLLHCFRLIREATKEKLDKLCRLEVLSAWPFAERRHSAIFRCLSGCPAV